MKILKESGNYLKNQLRKNLALTIICFASVAILILSSNRIFPIYINLGDYEVSRGILIAMFGIAGMHWWGQYKGYKRGLDGEGLVTKVLKSVLPDQFFLINDVKPRDGYGNIDHVILSPNGIFVIETKNYRGKITCQRDVWSKKAGGRIGSPSIQAKMNAVRIKKLIESNEKIKSLRLWIEAIIVFSNLDTELNINDPTVEIKNPYSLLEFLTNYKGKHQFSPQDLNLIGNEILLQTS